MATKVLLVLVLVAMTLAPDQALRSSGTERTGDVWKNCAYSDLCDDDGAGAFVLNEAAMC